MIASQKTKCLVLLFVLIDVVDLVALNAPKFTCFSSVNRKFARFSKAIYR